MFTYYKTYKELSKKINNNGFEYVDLGLPSGTLWGNNERWSIKGK